MFERSEEISTRDRISSFTSKLKLKLKLRDIAGGKISFSRALGNPLYKVN